MPYMEVANPRVTPRLVSPHAACPFDVSILRVG
jgi:hypothetical protein